MKIVSKILLIVISCVILLLSLVMMFVYGRLIVCKDFMIYDSPLNGFIRYFLRFVLSGLYLFMSIIEILSLDKKSIFIKKNLYFFEVLLLISSVIILVFSTNYIGLVTFGLMVIFHLFKTLCIVNFKGVNNGSIWKIEV